jgi:hypothetical protein
MADDFDCFLASSLAPPNRLPDRRFVAAVQTRIIVEKRLAQERRALIEGLVKQLVAVAAVGAAVLSIGRAPSVAAFLTDSPALAVLILLAGFSLLVALLSSRAGADSATPRHFSGLTN